MSKKKDLSLKKPEGKLSIVSNAVSVFFPTEIVKINRPGLEQNFVSLPTTERVFEAVKYSTLSFEYSISPNGGLRQWIKVNIALLLMLGIPALVFIILTGLFAEGMANVVEMLSAMVSATEHVLGMTFNLVKTLGLIVAVGTSIYFANQAYRKSGKVTGKTHTRSSIDITPGKKR